MMHTYLVKNNVSFVIVFIILLFVISLLIMCLRQFMSTSKAAEGFNQDTSKSDVLTKNVLPPQSKDRSCELIQTGKHGCKFYKISNDMSLTHLDPRTEVSVCDDQSLCSADAFAKFGDMYYTKLNDIIEHKLWSDDETPNKIAMKVSYPLYQKMDKEYTNSYNSAQKYIQKGKNIINKNNKTVKQTCNKLYNDYCSLYYPSVFDTKYKNIRNSMRIPSVTDSRCLTCDILYILANEKIEK